MAPLSRHALEVNTAAGHMYHDALPGSPAEEYLASRGLLDGASQFLLGWIEKPHPVHEDRFVHMLSIPYVTPRGIVGFKMRHIDGGDRRYDSPAGQKHHIFNTPAILDAVKEVLIVEGELDAVAATVALGGRQVCAVPGANSWRHWWRRCFDGIESVKVVTDNDDKDNNPGQELARRICEDIPHAMRVSLPLGHDVNSYIQTYGAHEFASLVDSL